MIEKGGAQVHKVNAGGDAWLAHDLHMWFMDLVCLIYEFGC